MTNEVLGKFLSYLLRHNPQKLSLSMDKDGYVDVVAKYSVKIPFINKRIHLSQRAYVKDWSGVSVKDDIEVVYITKNGKVYHKDLSCKHLNFNIRKVSKGKLESERNNSGGKYKECDYCGSKKTDVYYLTDDGDRYHSKLSCPSLTRNVISINISEVGERRGCKDCVK